MASKQIACIAPTSADESLDMASRIKLARERLEDNKLGVDVDEDNIPGGGIGIPAPHQSEEDQYGVELKLGDEPDIDTDDEDPFLQDSSLGLDSDPGYVDQDSLPRAEGKFSVTHNTTGEHIEGCRLDSNGHIVGANQDEELSIRAQIRRGFECGLSREQLKFMGYNANTIKITAAEMQRERGVSNIGKPETKAITTKNQPGVIKTRPGNKPVQAEELINAVHMPYSLRGVEQFEQGMKFGMTMTVLGVRLAQELSGVGISQAKPLLEMAKDMRSGEAAAAKSASQEASMAAAETVMQNIMPQIAQLGSAVNALEDKVSAGKAPNPMQKMMMDTMQPIMSNLMGKLMPMLGGGQVNQGQPQQSASSAPDGWTASEE